MFQNQSVAINSGDTLSGIIGVANLTSVGLYGFVPNSVALFVQGCFDQTSASFTRIADPVTPSSKWVFPCGSGRMAIQLDAVAKAFPFIRLEAGAALTGPGSFQIIGKRV